MKNEIIKIRKNFMEEISRLFPFMKDEDIKYLAAYMVSSTCCFNRYRCYINMDEEKRKNIGNKRETKYIAVLCEKKIQKMGYECNFESCREFAKIILSNYAKDILKIFENAFTDKFDIEYINKIAEYLSVVNHGNSEGNYEAAWSLLSVLNNIEKNNEKWEFWHIHGIIKEKINYFNREDVFDDNKIYLLRDSSEFWELINNAMDVYRKETDIIIWIANND